MEAIIPLLLLATMTGQADRAIVFQCDLWPGERLFPERLEVACRVELREAPSDAAKILPGATVGPGQTFSFEQTRYVTREPGAFTAVAATKIHGRVLGPIRYLSKDSYYGGGVDYADVPVPAGTLVEYLQYRAEGACFVRLRGDVIDADMCPLNVTGFQLVREPIVEKWAAVGVGKSTGWLKVDNACVKVVVLRVRRPNPALHPTPAGQP